MKLKAARNISPGLAILSLTLASIATPAWAQNPYRIATVAGTPYDRSGNNGPATQASISGFGVAFRDGYLYLADPFRIWRIDPAGTITTVVGILTPNPPFSPVAGYAGDGGAATSAGLRNANSIEFDSGGNLYISDAGDGCVRKVTARVAGGMPQPLNGSEIVTTFAGTCTQSNSILQSLTDLAYDPGSAGSRDAALYIAEPGSARIGKVDMTTNAVTNVAGSFSSPTGVAVDPATGTLYVADSGQVLRVDSSGTIASIAAPPSVIAPFKLRFGNGGILYVLDTSALKVWQIANPGSATPAISPVPGIAFKTGQDLVPDGAGGLFVTDSGNAEVYFAAAQGGTILGQTVSAGSVTVVAGPSSVPTFEGDNGPATQARLLSPQGVALDQSGNLYISDTGNNRVRMVDATGTITTVAGNGTGGFAGVPGPATSAAITPGILQYVSGTGLFIDNNNSRVLNESAGGNLTVVNGTAGIASAAGIAFDGLGNLYVGDTAGGNLWKVDPSGNATRLASGVSPSKGIGVDPYGNIYIAKAATHQIQKITPAGVVSIYAGTGIAGGSGDGGPALQATLQAPSGMVCDTAGNLYFTDGSNHTLRKIDTTGIITTIGGIPGVGGESGDGGLATNAEFQGGLLAFDAWGNLYLADVFNNAVRVLDNTLPTVTATAATADGKPYSASTGTNQTVTVHFACTDTGSGVAGCPSAQAYGSDGGYTATGTATDRAGNSGSGNFAGIEVDKTAPTISASATKADGTAYAAGAWTNQTVTVLFTCADNLSGVASCAGNQVLSAAGVTAAVSGTASDKAGNNTGANFGPVKIDERAPVISGMPGASCSLWPPNGKMVQVATVTAADDLSGVAPGSFTVTGVSNEDTGATQISIVPSGAGFAIWLQADRLGNGKGRVYTLTATAMDLAGNTTTATSTCVVPHDQGK